MLNSLEKDTTITAMKSAVTDRYAAVYPDKAKDEWLADFEKAFKRADETASPLVLDRKIDWLRSFLQSLLTRETKTERTAREKLEAAEASLRIKQQLKDSFRANDAVVDAIAAYLPSTDSLTEEQKDDDAS